MNNNVVVFDLDDTLYKEIDYLKSAFFEISIFLSEYINVNDCQDIIYNKLVTFFFERKNAFEQVLIHYNLNRNILAKLIEICNKLLRV